MGQQGAQGFWVDVAGADHQGFEAAGLRKPGDIQHVFVENGGLGVGERDGLGAALEGGFDDFFRGDGAGGDFPGIGLGDFPVLTEQAAEIAAGGGEGKGAAAGEDVIEGFFLDGVHMGGGDLAVGQGAEGAADVLSNAAQANLAVTEAAGIGAEGALNLAAGKGGPPQGFVPAAGGIGGGRTRAGGRSGGGGTTAGEDQPGRRSDDGRQKEAGAGLGQHGAKGKRSHDKFLSSTSRWSMTTPYPRNRRPTSPAARRAAQRNSRMRPSMPMNGNGRK